MSFWGNFIAAAVYGLASRRFIQKRYKDAGRLFEKVCRLESDDQSKEMTYSYLGRCYVALGKHHEAVQLMTKAYDLLDKGEKTTRNTFEQREYKEFLKAYSFALNKVGQSDRAIQINREAENILTGE